MKNPEKLLTVGDVCRMLRGEMTSEGVRRAMDRGDLKCLRTVGGTRLSNAEDVARWMARRAAKNGTAA